MTCIVPDTSYPNRYQEECDIHHLRLAWESRRRFYGEMRPQDLINPMAYAEIGTIRCRHGAFHKMVNELVKRSKARPTRALLRLCREVLRDLPYALIISRPRLTAAISRIEAALR